MINEACLECGACIDKCSHGVYDKKKFFTPAVVNPVGCIEGCHGCGSICPASAIRYAEKGKYPKMTADAAAHADATAEVAANE